MKNSDNKQNIDFNNYIEILNVDQASIPIESLIAIKMRYPNYPMPEQSTDRNSPYAQYMREVSKIEKRHFQYKEGIANYSYLYATIATLILIFYLYCFLRFSPYWH